MVRWRSPAALSSYAIFMNVSGVLELTVCTAHVLLLKIYVTMEDRLLRSREIKVSKWEIRFW